ncbi:glycosyl hydrolase [Rhodovulum kholense]|uniref:Putative glycosyl hydrolase n=1 Tax=Rhodovulum kholense TaxID=453584 RepID=A0A8E2VN06_9RHOB|nr:glycosyl hydrolase [Rhodovulum kholense]PTW51428.1 putative glycosyl hydrolase [Rhodovulum kholense]
MVGKTLFFLWVFLLSLAQTALAQKAGVGAWENSRYTTIHWVEDQPALGWYYTWRTDQLWTDGRISRTVEFVPMIHSESDLAKPITSDRPVRALMAFNEPDGKGPHQGGLSVERALALWPRVEAKGRGLRIGSPATTQAETLGPGSWQRRFMTEAERRGYRIDFMAVHYYSTDGDVAAFRRWLQAVHREYRRPIWVTEYALVDWDRPGAVSYGQSAAFFERAAKMMDGLPFVERHAWFAANPYPWQGTVPKINLVDDWMQPTPMGETFRRVLSELGGREIASAD